ncbi:helix-turn-helix domain-containing protein [Klebsiella variicola]
MDRQKHKRIAELLDAGLSIRKVAKHARCSTSTVQAVKRASG